MPVRQMDAEPFIAADAAAVLRQHGMDTFEALWALQLEPVDAPNTERGGWSSVCRLVLAAADGSERTFYLKRQDNHLTRSLRYPFGEPTFAREFRAIRDYAEADIPALKAAFFATRRLPGHHQAILLTHALDSYRPAGRWFRRWSTLPYRSRHALVLATAALVRRLHGSGRIHSCLYPKHIFLREEGARMRARLIDLEKTRKAWLGRQDCIRDLATLHRRTDAPSSSLRLRFLLAYLGKPRLDAEARVLLQAIVRRARSRSAG